VIGLLIDEVDQEALKDFASAQTPRGTGQMAEILRLTSSLLPLLLSTLGRSLVKYPDFTLAT
jgi:hypothetical protein